MLGCDMISKIWKRLMLRGTSFSGSYKKLRGLYLQADPWQMSSDKEQHRFIETNRMLANLAPKYGSILELGCGEGHQSEHLAKLTNSLFGLDVSEKAVERARKRCVEGTFAAAELERLEEAFGARSYDLITACEVLYYLPEIPAAIEMLKSKTDLIFVSNYKERAEKMSQYFPDIEWHRLDDITYEDTVWECRYWQRREQST